MKEAADAVAKNITMADLKGTLEVFARKFFGEKREIRLRPSYFPFTEPSVEVDISCHNCGGKGCSMCKHTGWIDILGAGMVNPKVQKQLRLSLKSAVSISLDGNNIVIKAPITFG